MGAQFNDYWLQADDKASAQKEFDELIESLTYRYGHDSYNGTFTTNAGGTVTFTDKTFDSVAAAEEWLVENAQKWEPVLAVKVVGRGGWYLGAWSSI